MPNPRKRIIHYAFLSLLGLGALVGSFVTLELLTAAGPFEPPAMKILHANPIGLTKQQIFDRYGKPDFPPPVSGDKEFWEYYGRVGAFGIFFKSGVVTSIGASSH